MKDRSDPDCDAGPERGIHSESARAGQAGPIQRADSTGLVPGLRELVVRYFCGPSFTVSLAIFPLKRNGTW